MLARLAAAATFAACAFAQHGTETRRNPSDYAAHLAAGNVLIAAEYLGRSAGTGRGMFAIPEHIVVDVAVFPASGEPVEVSAGQFRLRVNGKKLLLPQTPGMAAAALKYPDWTQRPHFGIGGGTGNAGVVLGRPRQVERFPGDRRPDHGPGPVAQTMPSTEDMPPEEIVQDAALPEGPASGPVSGYVYFYYKGKTKKIKSLELLYDTGERKAALKLR